MSLRNNRRIRAFARRFGGLGLLLPPRLIELPLRTLVRVLLRRFPRDPRLAVFGAPLNRFGDNAGYLFLHLSRQPGAPHCVWITGDKALVDRLRRAGLDAERRRSLRGVRLAARAKFFVITAYASDVNRWLHDGATLINLWHGIPLKAIERDIKVGPISYIYRNERK